MKPRRPVPPPTDPKCLRMLRQVDEDAPSKAGLFRKLYAPGGRVSPRHAIKCQCLQCCWMDKAAIRECTDTACPLWSFRPYREGRPTRRRSEGLESPRDAVPLSDVQRGSEQTTRKSPDLENAIGDSHRPTAAEIDPRKRFQEASTP